MAQCLDLLAFPLTPLLAWESLPVMTPLAVLAALNAEIADLSLIHHHWSHH